MKKTKHLLLASMIVAAPMASAELSYTYVTAGYVIDGEVDGTSFDLDGLTLGGSFAVREDVYIFGNYQALETDPGNIDVDRIDLGAGFHTPIAENIDFDVSLAYSDIEIGSADGDGFQLKGGLRGMPSSVFEWNAYLVYEDIDFDDSDTGYELAGRYFFAENISAGLTLRNVSDLETMAVNVRFDF
ncbi:hypothetical protein F6455_10065 [Proteobacteria bacterium 005FR1]|nr:hypothetical protein [Proteobacteria bacterium 005FR1]